MKRLRLAAFLMLFCSLVSHSWAQEHTPCENLFPADDQNLIAAGSTYIPIDSWIYPAIDRLHALGEVDTIYLGMRPWTRVSVVRALEAASDTISEEDDDSETCSIYQAMQRELNPDVSHLSDLKPGKAEVASIYTRFLGISGDPLRDSFHLAQSIVNDYGRPYQHGFNNVTGFSTRMESGRFAVYFRGEYQHAPDAVGYSPGLTSLLSNIDGVPLATNPVQDTVPAGPIAPVNNFRVVEANASYLLLNHEISFGKSDHWLGPAQGGSFAWSNNAENIYSFQIDRVEPLHFPLLSRFTGPFRYQFFVGSLKGHTDPNSP